MATEGPKILVYVWLDGEPKPGDNGDSVCEITVGVPSYRELAMAIRMVGVNYAARHRPVKISVYDLAIGSWCKPSGQIVDKFAAYALELDVRCGDVRV